MKDLCQIIMIHFCWVSIHYTAAHLYTKFCCPWTVVGVAFSSVMTMTPHCQAMRWCIFQGASSISSMWLSLGTWMAAKAMFISLREDSST